MKKVLTSQEYYEKNPIKLNPMSEWTKTKPKRWVSINYINPLPKIPCGKVELWKEDGIYNIRTDGNFRGVVELSEKQLLSLSKKINKCLKLSSKTIKKAN